MVPAMTNPEQLAESHRREVLAFVNECIEYFNTLDQVRSRQTSRRAFLSLYGPIMQVVRFASSAALLANSGHRIEGQVLARSALEYALTIQYVYLRVDGLDRLQKSSLLDRKKLMEDMANWHDDPEYLDMIPQEQPKPGAKGMPKFTQILEIVDPEHVILHSTYAVLSQVTHVRPGGRDRYFDRVDDQLVLVPGRDDDVFGNVTTGALGFALMAATWVFAHITEDEAMLARLDTTSDRLRLPTRYDGNWPVGERAFRD